LLWEALRFHFSLSSSLFTPTRLVGVVGNDFPAEHTELLAGQGIDLAGLEVVPDGKTFRWTGEYSADMNSRETLSVDLNVLEGFKPDLPESYRDCEYVFLANGDPATQLNVLDQMRGNPFVMADTMDLWIQTRHGDLEKLLDRIDGLVINDSEAMLFEEEHNIVRAGQKIRERGIRYVIIKKGEHGAILFPDGGEVYLPSTPLAEVKDPTGAGDSFAGGLMGYLAESGGRDLDSVKLAVAWGSVVASFCCQGFGVNRLAVLTREEADERFHGYTDMLSLRVPASQR
jgi:sugar/nucleoside kinase (ribokinase family)